MRSYIGVFLAGLYTTILLAGCNSDSDNNSSNVDSEAIQITGAGIKGPLAFSDVKIYALDPDYPEYYDNTSPISVAITDQYAEINGLSIPRKVKPPYIMVIDGSNGIDLNTGMAPSIDTLITVITRDMLAGHRPIFATPLTTLMFHIARLNTVVTEDMKRGAVRKAFEENINDAISDAGGTFLIGKDRGIDLLRTPLTINTDTVSPQEQELAVYHRAAVEAFAANVYMLAKREKISTDNIIVKLALDIHTDGVIDNSDNGIAISSMHRMTLSQTPMELQITNTPYRIKEIMQLMEDERILLGTDREPIFLVGKIEYPVVKNTDTRSLSTDLTQSPDPIVAPYLDTTNADTDTKIADTITDAPLPPDPVVDAPEDKIPTGADLEEIAPKETAPEETTKSGATGTESTVIPAPVIALSVDSINFGNQYIGETGDVHELVITNTGTGAFSIADLNITPGYLQSNNCDSHINPGESCIVDIQFYPDIAGLLEGTLTISGDTSEENYIISLTGFGMKLERDDSLLTRQQSTDILFYHDFNDEPLHTYTQTDILDTWDASQQFAKNNTIKIVTDPEPSGVHGHVMRAFYAANTVHNRDGSGFYFRKRIGSHNEMYFAYDVFFEEDAEFTKGGKLPGLGIPDYFSNSGVKPDGTDRWTGGLAWRKDGKIANYVYHADQPGIYGEIFLWEDGANGQAYFKRGEWNRIEIYYKMNTPGVADGRIKGWLNGELALDSSRPMYRMPGGEHLTIGAMAMATMYGGGSTFAPLTDQYIYFDNFVVSTKPITH